MDVFGQELGAAGSEPTCAALFAAVLRRMQVPGHRLLWARPAFATGGQRTPVPRPRAGAPLITRLPVSGGAGGGAPRGTGPDREAARPLPAACPDSAVTRAFLFALFTR